MGCDIHVAIQVRDNERWTTIPYQERWGDSDDRPLKAGIVVAPRGFTSRNYDLFGILANVRNGSGFAGLQTGDGWPSIAPDRGCPDDITADDLFDPDDDVDGSLYLGDHSFTWIALEELEKFDWDLTHATLYGVLNEDQFKEFAETGEPPKSYASGISGPDIHTYTPETYKAAKATATLVKKPYVRVAWTESARSATNDWPGKVVPWLREIAAGRPLRLVMGFDS